MRAGFLACFFIPSLLTAVALSEPTAVLVIGGGPAGLSCAIEAALKGCDTTIVEKREEYTRKQPIILWNQSLKILDKWNIFAPEIILSNCFEDGIDRGVTGVLRIKNIEKHLSRKCCELAVKRITGEFLSFDENRNVLIKTLEEDISIPYDILIGADGFYSNTRDALSIPMNEFGRAKGAYVIIPDFSIKKRGIHSDHGIKEGEEIVGRNLVLSSGIILNFQAPEEATGEQIRNFAMRQGWKKEVQGIDQGYAYSLKENIPIVLAQAQAFSSVERSALLVGDSAVSISFLFGDGVNSALVCSEFVGAFLEKFRENREEAFETFNASMKIETDRILKRSAVLFEEKVRQ